MMPGEPSNLPLQTKLIHKTFSELLQKQVHENAKQPAIYADSKTISYDDLTEQVLKLANGLSSLGIGKGDVVAVQLPNTPEFIITYLAITSLGAIMQTLHMPYQQAEMEYLLNDSNATAIVALSHFKDYSPAGIAVDIADTQDNPFKIISLGAEVDKTISYTELSQFAANGFDNSVRPDNDFILLYTSGTTSQPKGILHSYERFLNNANLCAEEYGFNHTDKLLSLAPLSHLYGLFVCNMTLCLGASAVLLPAFDPKAFVNIVKTQMPTAIFAGPAHFNACLQAELLQAEDFNSVKFVCLSGSHVPVELARRVDGILNNGKVGQLWGMSELQAGAITRLSDTKQTRTTTAGRMTPGTELRISSFDDKILPANTEGELQVKGLSVFSAYLNKPEETADAFTIDGWFKTGDMAMLDEAGNLQITGRTKHIINRGGVKYNPIEVEDIINRIEHVQMCAIVPKPDNVLGEKACLFIQLEKQQNITLKQITKVLSQAGLAKYKWPEELVIVESMPLTPTQKIKREVLIEQFQIPQSD